MKLVLATKQQLNTLECDIWRDENRNPYMTIEQLAKGLGYKSKKAIEQHLRRSPRLREKRFSIVTKLPTNSGYQETRLFNKNGIMEICFLSHTKNTEAFRDWAIDIINAFEDGQLEWKVKRELEKPVRKELTAAVSEWEHKSTHSYIHITNLICKVTTGLNTKQLKEQRQQTQERPIYDVLTPHELEQYIKIENQVITLLELQQSYEAIKNLLKGANYHEQTRNIKIG